MDDDVESLSKSVKKKKKLEIDFFAVLLALNKRP